MDSQAANGEKPRTMTYRRAPIHSMQRRSPGNDYNMPGIYHITITVFDRKRQSLGSIKGSLDHPDGHPDAPRVELTAIGKMVEHELLHSITEHYPVIEVQDYVIMPEHLHFLAVVKNSLISKNGRMTHLGQVIAGFKKGCSRRYWEITGQAAANDRPPLFSYGYVDVIPLEEGQLETQRTYIRANPRNRLLRMSQADQLKPQRAIVDTLVTPAALRGYLIREHALSAEDQQGWEALQSRLLIANNHVVCDGYGHRHLLERPLLPVVCHRKDKRCFAQHKQRCLDVAGQGSVLVSARIAPGEQEIMDEAIRCEHPVALVVDNGFPVIYHPSEQRLSLCSSNRLLLLSPWKYQYRPHGEEITEAQCKTMNCIAQAICQRRDDWWMQ